MYISSTIIILDLLILLISSSLTNGAYIALTNSIPKCVVVNSPKGSMFEIEYTTHDSIVQEEKNNGNSYNYKYASDRIQQTKTKTQLIHDHDPTTKMNEERRRKQMMGRGQSSSIGMSMGMGRQGQQDGRDEMWQKRHRDMIQRNMDIIRKNSGITITIDEFDEGDKAMKKSPPPTTSNHSLSQKVGSFKHKMQSSNTAKICINSYGASSRRPTFISLQIREVYLSPKVGKDEQNSPQSQKDKKIINDHMVYLERELYMLIQAAERIIDESSLSKVTYSRLYKIAMKLPLLIKWISIGQIFIILLTATFYCRFVLSNLRKKRIIY